MKDFIHKLVNDEKENLIFLRRELHKHPELSENEYKTAEFIENYLKNTGLSPVRVTKTGVIAFLDCDKEKTTLLRADIDALPVTEKNDVEYKSQTEGVMHACGHDAHTAMLLSTAKILSENKEKLSKNVLFVFQPAEETDGGAEDIIKTGIIEKYNVDMALGFHVLNDVPAGKVMIKPGALMASPDEFYVDIVGKGGHGAMPRLCIDPIMTASAIIPRINAITNMDLGDDAGQVVQCCTINAGATCNVIPGVCKISGTIRSFSDATREKIPQLIENIIKEETSKTHTSYNVDFVFGYPPLVNSDDVAEIVQKKLINTLGDVVVNWDKPLMLGEDFAYFAKKVPSLFMFLGTGNEEKGITKPLHNDEFMIDEDGMLTGVSINLAVLFS